MKPFLLTLLALAAPVVAAPLLPLSDGTTWKYLMTEEAGEGLGFSGHGEEKKLTANVAYRLSGTQNADGKELLKFEIYRAGTVTNTDLMTVDEHGVICRARINGAGTTTKLEPSQPIVVSPVNEGTRWDYDAQIGNGKVHQHYAVVRPEDIVVPAGKFRAMKILGEQTEPGAMVIERWFVEGVGIVKDVTTTRDADGRMLRRITLELQEKPKVAPRPEPNDKRLSVTLGTDATGPGATEFATGTEKISARWQGSGLQPGTKIRAVWIAANVEEVPEDYTIDEATATAEAASSQGVFVLGRPEDGWAAGDYRLDVYLDDQLADSIKLKIGKP